LRVRLCVENFRSRPAKAQARRMGAFAAELRFSSQGIRDLGAESRLGRIEAEGLELPAPFADCSYLENTPSSLFANASYLLELAM
jgi:hypothetical protein